MRDHPTPATPRFAIYARVSDATLSPDTLAAQVERCQEHARALGLPVTAIYTEIATGYHAARPQLRSLEEAIRNREIDGVILASLDRLGRSVLDTCDLLCTWDELGVAVVLVEPSEDMEVA